MTGVRGDWVQSGEYQRIYAPTGEPEVWSRFTVFDWVAIAAELRPTYPVLASVNSWDLVRWSGLSLAADVRVAIHGCRAFANAVGAAAARAGVEEYRPMTAEDAIAGVEAFLGLRGSA